MPPKTKIFVGKLPKDCTDAALRKLFERHGEVTECSVLGNFAFVHMRSEDEALEAIEALNNFNFQGSNLSVEPSTGEKRSGGRGGYRGGRGSRGGFGAMRQPGRGGSMRPGPYDRPMGGDRYGRPSLMSERYGSAQHHNGYYDDYDRREPPMRRPLPPLAPSHHMPDRRPLPPPPSALSRDPYARDPYDRYDGYDRMMPLSRRSPPPPMMMERRPPLPLGYDRRPDPYSDLYRERDAGYSARDVYEGRRSHSPHRYAGPPRDMHHPPTRRY